MKGIGVDYGRVQRISGLPSNYFKEQRTFWRVVAGAVLVCLTTILLVLVTVHYL